MGSKAAGVDEIEIGPGSVSTSATRLGGTGVMIRSGSVG